MKYKPKILVLTLSALINNSSIPDTVEKNTSDVHKELSEKIFNIRGGFGCFLEDGTLVNTEDSKFSTYKSQIGVSTSDFSESFNHTGGAFTDYKSGMTALDTLRINEAQKYVEKIQRVCPHIFETGKHQEETNSNLVITEQEHTEIETETQKITQKTLQTLQKIPEYSCCIHNSPLEGKDECYENKVIWISPIRNTEKNINTGFVAHLKEDTVDSEKSPITFLGSFQLQEDGFFVSTFRSSQEISKILDQIQNGMCY